MKNRIEVVLRNSIKNRIITCNYLYIDENVLCDYHINGNYYDDIYNLYFYGSDTRDFNIPQGDELEVLIRVFDKLNIRKNISIIKILPLIDITLNRDNFLLIGQLDFSYFEKEPFFSEGFQEFDQEIIDIFHYCEINSSFKDYKKHSYAYCKTSLLYSGIPEIICSKDVCFNGEEFSNPYHFYNILAEKLLGEKAYLGSNLDALEETLHELSLKCKIQHPVSIEIKNSKVFDFNMSSYTQNFLKQIIEIMNDNKIKVVLS